MTASVYPLSLPADLRREIKSLAGLTGLSEADVMRQTMRLGSPLLRERLATEAGRLTNVEPIPSRTWRRIYRKNRPDDDADPHLLTAQSNPLEAD